MKNAIKITSEIEQLFAKMEEICHDLAWNRFDRSPELFELTRTSKYPAQIAKLAESFGIMLVKVEAREYKTEQIMAELKRTARELEISRRQLIRENAGLKKGLRERFSSKRIIGKSPQMRKILDQVERIADTSVNVLITGETGTGKELIAKALHYNSIRNTGPFIAINCSAVPEALFESELFGIEKGVATGVNKRKGLVELAHRGTLFLDEIGDMPMPCQAKILRIIEEREVTRVGGSKPVEVDIRVVAASNKNLRYEAEVEKFRRDLFFRLNVVPLCLPPLRERKQDIPLLLKRFVQVHCQNMNYPLMTISSEAMQALISYDWPGNVRELENEVERLVALSCSQQIKLIDLSPPVREAAEHEPEMNELQEMAGPPESSTVAVADEPVKQRSSKKQSDKEQIEQTLKATGGNKTQAARILGISREGLRKKIIRLFGPEGIEIKQ